MRALKSLRLLGREERERLLSAKDERNPLFKEAHEIGEVQRAALKTRATAKERLRQRDSAAKAARLSKRDAGRTVIFDTAGNRFRSFADVPRKRKVYVARVNRAGAVRWFNVVDPKTLMRGVRAQIMPQDPAHFDFRRWVKAVPREYGSIAAQLAGRRPQPVWRGQDVLFRAKVRGNDLDSVTKRVAAVFDEAVRSQAGMSQWVGEGLLLVKGEKKPLQITTPVLNSGQFYELPADPRKGPKAKRGGVGLARDVIAFKIRDLVRAELAHRGLVSKGSARRVARYSWNRGRPRKKWTLDPERTKPWRNADKRVVELGEFQFRMRQIF